MIGSRYFGEIYLGEDPEIPVDVSKIGARYMGGIYLGEGPAEAFKPGIELVWDTVGNRKYENGLDRGVLYLPDGRAIPWNGLTSIVETENRETSSNYFDGMKISTLVTTGDYTATLKAFTYPDEFDEFQGMGNLFDGVYLENQPVKAFDLSYRTLIGTDLNEAAGYKIHILYNVIALPKDKTYATLTDSSSLLEFEWDISAVQEEIDGHSPTSHIIIDTTQVSAAFIKAIESLLYGTLVTDPSLPVLDDLIKFLKNLSTVMGTVPITIVDNGDGTWTATSDQDDLISINTDDSFVIIDANAEFDGDQYVLSDTVVD